MSTSSPEHKNSLADRLPFYYGWLMVFLTVITQTVTGVGQTYGISVFNPSFRDALQISLSQLTGAYMVGTLLAAVPQPYVGSLMDRFGIRRTMTGVVILLGGACLLISRVGALWNLLLAFFLLRLLGQGALSLLSGNIPPMWFREKLGTVTGLVAAGFSVSLAVVPPFFLFLINRFGWRDAYALLGLAVWGIMLPLLGLLFRDVPAEVGQFLDGGEVLPEEEADAFGSRSMDVKAARRTPAYWIVTIDTGLWAMILTAVFFNLLLIFDSFGISEAVAAATFTTYAAASLGTQLAAGPLADRVPLQYLLFACLVLMAGSIGVLSLAGAPWQAHLYAVLMGVSTGLISVVSGTLWARYFGRKHLGKLRGNVVAVQVAGSSLGPFITGVIFDLTGSYQLSLWVFMGLLVPAAAASLWAANPRSGGLGA